MEYQIEEALYQAPSLSPSIWRRLHAAHNRFYYPVMGEIKTLAGITTILEKCLPSSKEKIDWLIKNGWEGLGLYAEFGTAGHTVLAEYNLGNDWTQSISKKEWQSKLDNLIVAWDNTLSKYEIVELLLVETPVWGKINGCEYVTTIDFCAKMRVPYRVKKERVVETGEFYQKDTKENKKGDPKTKIEKYTETEYKEEIWIIDYKTNYDSKDSKDYYDSHLFQLLAQKKAMKLSYNIDVDRIFNWSDLAFKTDRLDNTFQLVEWVVQGKEYVGDWNHKGFSPKKFTVLNNHMQNALLEGWNLADGKLKSKVYLKNAKGRTVPMYSTITYTEWVEEWRKQKENKIIEEEMDSTELFQTLFIRSEYPELITLAAENHANKDAEWILKGYIRDIPREELMKLIGKEEASYYRNANPLIGFEARKDWFLLIKPIV